MHPFDSFLVLIVDDIKFRAFSLLSTEGSISPKITVSFSIEQSYYKWVMTRTSRKILIRFIYSSWLSSDFLLR